MLTPAIFRPLYLAVVRPHLDYAVQASFPYLQEDTKLIERMWRLATRCVKSFRRLPYQERLHELKLPSMERHFLRATLITVYKLFHAYLNLSAEEFFEQPAAGHLREHNFKVRQPRFHLARRKRLLLFVRPDRGIDCLHTSPKLRQCPASRIAWMPIGAPSSLTLFTSFTRCSYVNDFGAQLLLFRPVNLID